MEYLLKAESISKVYGAYKALNNVSIAVPKGSIFGLLGPNGAGKTSLIRIINQITFPDSGHVTLDGELLQPHHIKDIGYLPEERGLYRTMKVGEQALYLAQLKGVPKTIAKKRLKMWFERLEIQNWWDKKIQELSKGMAQKIQFIVTVLHEPKLFIFDEPFSGFDPINANRIKNEILRLKNNGATVIFSTHRMESVEELCDYIALLHHSEKLLDGELNTIKKQFKTNTYQVGINAEDNNALKQELAEHFTIEDTTFKSINNELKINIKLSVSDTPKAIISYLNTKGTITHFTELTPSVNDIFIQAIQNH